MFSIVGFNSIHAMHFYSGCHVLSLQIVLLYSQTLVVVLDVQTKLVAACIN